MAKIIVENTNAIKPLQESIDAINKQFGEGSIIKFSEKPVKDIEVIKTGSIDLDIALGVGGIPRGRITEIFGQESSGKTTVCLHLVANVQNTGGKVAYVDAEHALDLDYAKALGVDVDELLLSQPSCAEEALGIVDVLVRTQEIKLVIIDSVAALVPRAELAGEVGDSHIGIVARMMGQTLRKITAAADNNNVTVIFINQLREKIGISFGSPITTTGGKSLKFFASVRLDIARIETLKDGTGADSEAVANRTRVKIVKNKVAPPFKVAEFDIVYGEGISREGSLIDVGVKYGIIKKSGAWYSYDGDQLGQGKEKTRKMLADNPELSNEIESKIFTAIRE